MPATSPEALARRRERAAERKRELRVDPAYRERYNARRRVINGKPRPPAKPKWKRVLHARFVGCDGEGTTDPKTGEHRYALFRMGDRELYKGGRRLATPELLQFIVDHPDPRDYLVGFFFEYDANCIVRDIERERDPKQPKMPSRLERLLALDIANWQGKPDPHKGHFWTWLNFDGFRQFGVSWIGRNHIKVCHSMPDPEKPGRYKADPRTIRTIEDVGGNFQCSFVKALELWGIGSKADVDEIAATKPKREQFAKITKQIRHYNAIECTLLAELMETFRVATLAAGIVPRTWNGAGKLAAALLTKHGVMKRKVYEERFPDGLRTMARAAYYGARFETTRAGEIDEMVHALDIKSAFPAEMVDLPCLEHGTFRQVPAASLAKVPRSALWLSAVRFYHPSSQFLCGLPIRSRKGPISWPREGCGYYWSTEIRSARRLGARIEFLGKGWLYEKRCNCQPFAWMQEAFDERLKLDQAHKGRGTPLKNGINSCYGKIVQRVGSRTWSNHVWGGLITAGVRAKLLDAIRSVGQRNVLMIAADAIYTIRRRPKVRIAKDVLGAWAAETYPGLFIVQPGVYWPLMDRKPKLKTRGVSMRFLEPCVPIFEDKWSAFAEHVLLSGFNRPPPHVGVPIRSFISLRLAYRLKDPATGASWQPHVRKISFAWSSKRQFESMSEDGWSAVLRPLPGDRDWWSVGYDEQGKRMQLKLDDDGALADRGELMASDARMLIEAMPDPIDLDPPFTD